MEVVETFHPRYFDIIEQDFMGKKPPPIGEESPLRERARQIMTWLGFTAPRSIVGGLAVHRKELSDSKAMLERPDADIQLIDEDFRAIRTSPIFVPVDETIQFA